MAKTRKKTLGYGRLIEAWDPPEGVGHPIGCVATTFTFSPVFYEEECLGRFLQMQSDAVEDGPVYLIEREEKLNSISCATVLVDSHHCRGIRSLRWDLLSVRPPRGILHAKISLLQWSRMIRVVISSANLTENGYRRNQEIFGVLDYLEGSDAPLECLTHVVAFLREVGTYAERGPGERSPAMRRLEQLLDGILETSTEWGKGEPPHGRKAVRVHPIFTAPGRTSVLEQFLSVWPEGTWPTSVAVTSPFFDSPGSPNFPAEALWKTLRQRGKAHVTFNVTGEDITGEEAILLHAPRELLGAQPRGRAQVGTDLKLIAEQDVGESSAFRSLHMKNLWFTGADWLGHVIGSSNFTSAGLGLNVNSNLEANLLYLVSKSGNPQGAKKLQAGSPEGEKIDKNLELRWQVKPEDDEDSPGTEDLALPAAFGQAVYRMIKGSGVVELSFSGPPPAGWRIFREVDSEDTILEEKTWKEQGSRTMVPLPWPEDRPPSGFEVSWDDSLGRAWWPVNVDKPSSLPPPTELRDLPLEVLIDILTSARPLHQAMRSWLKSKERGGEHPPFVDPHDPHKRVDTSAFLLQKTRRVSWALKALRERLERPAASDDALEWRLHGPVGITAVANAIAKEAKSDEEKAFLLTELALDIARARPKTAPGHLASEQVRTKIEGTLADLRRQVTGASRKAPKSMKKYIKRAFSEIVQ